MKRLSESSFCVLGASGFIGTNLVIRLSEVAKSVTAVSRSGSPDYLAPSKVFWVSQDIADVEALTPTLRESDFVVHLVSSTNSGPDSKHDRHYANEDALSTLKLLDMCADVGVRKFIFLSSGGSIYGNAVRIPTPETATTNPLTAYASHKLSMEETLSAYKRERGLDYVAIRASNPYGPHQIGRNRQGIIGTALIAGLQGEPLEVWGDGSMERDFIYIDDLVDGILKARTGATNFDKFNIGSGQGLTVNSVLDLCDAVLDTPIRRIYKEARVSDVQRSILDISRAKTHLDWVPRTDIARGIGLTKLWLEANEEVWN